MKHTIDTPKHINNKLISLPHSINTPKYLKKVVTEKAWTQPVLTQNNTLGGSLFACTCTLGASDPVSEAYKVFDGSTSSIFYTLQGSNVEFVFYNPHPLKITALTMTADRYNNIVFYASNDNSTWEQLSLSADTVYGTVTLNVNTIDTGHKYYKLTMHGYYPTGRSDFQELVISATEKTTSYTAGTSSDYDVIIPQPHSINTPKYLKKVITEKAWTQPILSADGTLGGDSFAVYAYGSVDGAAYKAFDDIVQTYQSNCCHTMGNGYIEFYNPTPIKLVSIQTYDYVTNVSYRCEKGIIYGSNDGTNWDVLTTFTQPTSTGTGNLLPVINVNSNNAYKYFKIKNEKSGTGGTSGEWVVPEIIITATEQTWQECTKEEYD